MAKNLSEVPMLSSVNANYTIGYSDSTARDYNYCMPRRVNVFDQNTPWSNPEPFGKTDEIDKILNSLSNTDKDKEIKRLKATIENLREQIKGESRVSTRRLVKVVIVDPNENLKLEDAVLVNEAEKITDLEDNEIFFDMDIKKILDAHNTKRESTVDKKASKNKDKDVFLDPIKIRDLKMTVITVAEF